jgi:hypothetical protein
VEAMQQQGPQRYQQKIGQDQREYCGHDDGN